MQECENGVQISAGTAYSFVGLDILTAVFMKSSVFRDITPCSPLKVNGSLGLTYPTSGSKKKPSKQSSACYLLHIGIMLGLFFDFQEGGDMHLRNVC
jgi:hypothetical protein